MVVLLKCFIIVRCKYIRSRELRLTTVGDLPRWPRDTLLSTEVDTKFRRQVSVAQSVLFACGLRATELSLRYYTLHSAHTVGSWLCPLILKLLVAGACGSIHTARCCLSMNQLYAARDSSNYIFTYRHTNIPSYLLTYYRNIWDSTYRRYNLKFSLLKLC
jgi:hypothetical protein